MPRAELLAPLAGAHTNVRDVLLDRSMRTLRKRLGDPGQLQPAHNDLTAVEEEALRMLLVCRGVRKEEGGFSILTASFVLQQKDGVPPEVHRTIKDRGTLFAVARLLIGLLSLPGFGLFELSSQHTCTNFPPYVQAER